MIFGDAFVDIALLAEISASGMPFVLVNRGRVSLAMELLAEPLRGAQVTSPLLRPVLAIRESTSPARPRP